ncbi:MAG: hypothetical protein HC868_00255 [Sphingomonadales bacterium]|nr:hypothetical protein [Sphingomonadales bacterium]
MVWRFLKHYGMNKATDILDEFATAVVAFDPQAASKAQVAMMEVELNKLGRRLADAEAELRREHQETLELEQSYRQYLDAAHVLQGKLDSIEDPDRQSETEASLAKIVDRLERLKPEIEREKREDQEVEDWRAELRSSFEELGRKVRGAHDDLKSARRQMDMASLQRQRAAEQERRTKEAAGITSSIGSLSVALDAMNQETMRVRAETETLKLKAGMLQADRLDVDPIIAAALSEARGKHSIGKGTVSERLAALSGGQSAPKLISAA